MVQAIGNGSAELVQSIPKNSLFGYSGMLYDETTHPTTQTVQHLEREFCLSAIAQDGDMRICGKRIREILPEGMCAEIPG